MKNLKVYLFVGGSILLSGTIGFVAGQVKRNTLNLSEPEAIVAEETTDIPETTEEMINLELAKEEPNRTDETVSSSEEGSTEMVTETELEKENESKQEQIKETEQESVIETEETSTETVTEETEAVEETQPIEETKVVEETMPTEESFAYFEQQAEEVEALSNQGETQTATSKGKEYLQSGIDFVLHGKEIHGVTFDELTEKGKQETIDNLNSLYGWISGSDSYYRDQFGEDFKAVLSYAKEKYNEAKEKGTTEEKESVPSTENSLKEEVKGQLQDEWENIKDTFQDIKSAFRR